MVPRWSPIVALVVGPPLGGCPTVGPYMCATDSDCDRLDLGVCLSDGACAYAAPTAVCPSGLARSSEAVDDPSACVPLEGGADSESSADAGSSSGGDDSADTAADTASSVCWSTEFSLALDVLGSESLAGYPLRVRLSDPLLAEAAREQRLDAFDATGTPLALERAPESDEGVDFWLRLPVHTTDVVPIRLVARPLAGIPLDTSVVWAEYRSVWHLDDAIEPEDATFENHAERLEPLVAEVPLDAEQSVPAMLDRGVALDGLDDVLTATTSYWGSLDSFSLSLWARFDGADVDDPRFDEAFLVTGINGDGVYPQCNRRIGGKIDCRYRLKRESDQDVTVQVGSFEGFSAEPGVWFHVAFTRDAATGTATMLVDGVHKSATEPTTPNDLVFDGGATPLSVGRAFGYQYSEISVDEIRITDRALPLAWLRADVLSQQDPTLAVVDAEFEIVDVDCPP